MMKMKYFAPETELVEIVTEVNFLGTINGVSSALGHSTTEEADDYNSGSVISW
jgi:hypothetical protein